MQVLIKTYGCQMNSYDSEAMFNILREKFSAQATDSVELADLVILNTCSIREKAEEKVFSELGRWRKQKEKNPDLIVGVTGCVASQEGESIIKRAPVVDFVLGPQTIHRLGDMVSKHRKKPQKQVDVSFPAIEKFDHLPKPRPSGVNSYVSIMEGCNKYCSFCIVPYTRGEEVSRPFKDVIKEVVALAENGVKEVNLLGQNVNDYYGQLDDGVGDLALLIHYVSAIEGIERIRFTTSHPNAFTRELAQAYAEEPKLVSHLHFPVQSGSDRILTAMKRGYGASEYLDKIAMIKEARPNIAFSSDFIVGFPGETEHDFQQTMDLIDKVQFDVSFSFIYSPRPGTPAASLEDNTPLSVKKERLALLQEKLLHYSTMHAHSMKGKTFPVLIEGMDRKTRKFLQGRTENNRVVLVPGQKNYIGSVINVDITEICANTLRGRVNNLSTKQPMEEFCEATEI